MKKVYNAPNWYQIPFFETLEYKLIKRIWINRDIYCLYINESSTFWIISKFDDKDKKIYTMYGHIIDFYFNFVKYN